MTRTGLSLLILFFIPAVLPAETPVVELQPMEVGASRLPDPVFAGPASAQQSLSHAEIVQLNPISVWEALETMPGLYIEQPGGMGGNASLYLRGGDPNFTKVMIDGVEVNDLNSSRGGTYAFGALAPRAVQSLHLHPGAQSAIHGSDALSGVILVETISPQGTPGQELSLELGDGEYYSIDGRAGANVGDWYVQGGLNRAREDDAVEGSSFDALRANAGAVLSVATDSILTFSTFASDLDRSHYPDDSGGPQYSASDLLDEHESQEWGSSLRLDAALTDDLRLNGKLAYYTLDADVRSPGVAPGLRDPVGAPANNMFSQLDRWVLSGSLSQQLGESLHLAYGAELVLEDGESTSELILPFGVMEGAYDREVRTASVFTELGWEFLPGQRLHGALRYDDVEDLDEVLTSRVAYLVDVARINSQLQLEYGEGFKKPSFFALGNPIVGNPDLEPEESTLYQLSLVTRLRDGAITLTNTVYRQEFRNLIDLSELGPPRMINLSEVVSEGVTTEIDWRMHEQFSLGGSASWLDLEVVDSDELLRNRPKWRLRTHLTYYPRQDISLTLVGTYVGDRLDSSIPTGTRMLEETFLADLVLAWSINPNLRLTLAVDDVLDERIEEAVGFHSPGRRFRASALLKW